MSQQLEAQPEAQPAAPPLTTAVTGHHLPALNGLRAVAVAGVVAYHLQFRWAKGGYLGVDLFFVLSGFLITTLLLEEWVGTRRIDLLAFWGRRAKRLLPALFLMVGAVGLYLVANAYLGGPGANGLVDLSSLRGDAISTLLYVNNWHSIYTHQSYFAQFSTPSPFQHTWSLAIEEQFYLVWPIALLLLFHFFGRSWRSAGRVLTVILGLLSALLMAVMFHPGTDPTRVYYGTDSRLFALMAGAAIAFVAAARPQPGRSARSALHVAAPLAAIALGAFWVTAGTAAGLPTNFMFEGGFLICAVLAAVMVADARLTDPGRLSRLLALKPLEFIGTISYGIYLWHWPVIVYLNGARTGLPAWPLDLLRIAATLVLSTLSYYLVERPIRRARLHGWVGRWGAPLAGIGTAVVIVVATIPGVAEPTAVASTTHLSSKPGTVVAGAGGYKGQQPIHLATPPTRTSPLRVMVIGDSVMQDASIGVTAALSATGEATVDTRTFDGFGLTTAGTWRASLPILIRETGAQIILASWSWDMEGPTTPNALHQPVRYERLLSSAVSVMLTPGNGVQGVIFTQFPLTGTEVAVSPAETRTRDAGVSAWNSIAEKMTRLYPGKVMYLPLANSILLHGHFSTWLPPTGVLHAPKDQWIRVRRVDNVHLCPEGSARYGNAVLADMTSIFGLAPAGTSWAQGPWTANPEFNTPPGSCPDDHPPQS